MNSFAQYLKEQIECYKAFHFRKFFSEEESALEGAVLLDSIFFPLYEYTDLYLSTDLDHDCFTDRPIDYLNQMAMILKLIDNVPEKQKKNVTVGNPFVIVEDYNNLFSLAPIFKDDGEIVIKSERLSEAKIDLSRKRGLYNLLRQISLILNIIVKSISTKPEWEIGKNVRALFLLYALDRKFKILKHFFSSIWNNIEFVFYELYQNYECKDESNCAFAFEKIEYVSRIMARRVAKYIIDNRSKTDDFNDLIISMLNSISDLYEIEALICKEKLFGKIKEFSEIFTKKYLQPNSGLMDFFLDIGKSFPYSDEIRVATQNQKKYKTVKNKFASFNYYSRHYGDKESKDTMINPFPNPEWDYGEKDGMGCPFRLYTMPLMKLYESLAVIEKELEEKKDCAKGWGGGKDCDALYENMSELCKPFLSILKEENKILGFEQIAILLHETVKMKTSESNYNAIILRFGRNVLRVIKQFERIESRINRFIDKTTDKIEKNRQKHDFYSLKEDLDTIFNPILIRYAFSKAKRKTNRDNNTKNIDSVYRAFKFYCINLKYQYLLKRIANKEVNIVLNGEYSMKGDNLLFASNKPIPYVEKRSISEWKEFFVRFCYLSEEDNVRCLQCEKGNHRICFTYFMNHLREVYIQQYIQHFS